MSAPALDLIDEIQIGPSRGGRRPARPLAARVVRSLALADLPAINAPPSTSTSPNPSGALPVIQQLRYPHHRLAQLLAKGTPAVEISLITGYSASRISILQRDPSFAELVAQYAGQHQELLADGIARLHQLGITALEELQARIDAAPDKLAVRELMELAEMGLLKPRALAHASASGQPGAVAVALNVKFVSPSPTASETMIEATAKEVRDGGD